MRPPRRSSSVASRCRRFEVDERVGECRYGDWTNQPLKTLAKEPLWKVVQAHPSAAVFPGDEGESMADMSARAVGAVRDWNVRLSEGGRTRRTSSSRTAT